MEYTIKRFDELTPICDDSVVAQSLIIDFTDVFHIRLEQIAMLLRLRKSVLDQGLVLALANIGTNVWGEMLVIGCDRMFFFAPTVAKAEEIMEGCVQTVDGIPENN